MSAAPIVMLGMDSADAGLIQRWIAAGRLPVLAELAKTGLRGDLRSPANLYAGAVWPNFYTGSPPEAHGIYGNKLWNQDAMRIEVPSDRWLESRPFYEAASAAGLKVCAIDVPMVLGPPRPLNGLCLCGWGTHDLISSGSEPAGLWADLKAKHGAPRLGRERFGRQTGQSLLDLRRMMIEATAQAGDIARDLLTRDAFDLSLIVFGATHRGGHYLHDTSQIDRPSLTEAERHSLDSALLDIYEATDREIGRIIEILPDNATVIVFALHGMGANPGWSEFFGDILDSLEAHRGGRLPKKGLIFKIRKNLPFHLARPFLTRLPTRITDRLVRLWSTGMFDWRQTRHFPMAMADAGYLRLNLKGRERDGIVEPDEYDAECARLETLILSLVDAATGRPIAQGPVRPWQDAQGAPARDVLPDIAVPWSDLLARDVTSLTSTLAETWRFDVPRTLPSGRSGNHLAQGWFVARGPGVEAGLEAFDHGIEDLAPSVMTRLGLPLGPRVTGRVIEALAR